jgi:hypothetical protein
VGRGYEFFNFNKEFLMYIIPDEIIQKMKTQASEILTLIEAYEYLRCENEELRQYKKLYFEHLDKSIKSNKKIIGQMLEGVLGGAIVPKIPNQKIN